MRPWKVKKLKYDNRKYEKQLINAEESARNVDLHEFATCEVSHFHKYMDNMKEKYAIRSVDCIEEDCICKQRDMLLQEKHLSEFLQDHRDMKWPGRGILQNRP